MIITIIPNHHFEEVYKELIEPLEKNIAEYYYYYDPFFCSYFIGIRLILIIY
jgi:hypothetical protein